MRVLSPLAWALPFLVACGGPGTGAKAPATSAASAAKGSAPTARPPLSSEEQSTKERLGKSLEHLSTKIGERNPHKPWELADAADYFAAELEALGYGIQRQGYEVGEVVAHNLIATAPGGAGGEQIVLVAAHYDSPKGDAGRNAGGSGALAVLELARAFAKTQQSRTLRFCLFGLGESPHGDGPARGSRVYGESLQKVRQLAEAELARDAEAKASGALPAGLPEPAVDRSRVVAVILLDRLLQFDRSVEGGREHVIVRLSAGPGADAYTGVLADNLSESPLLVQRLRLEGTAAESDATFWLGQNVPVVLVQGDSGPTSSTGTDDLDALTRVVFGVRAALRDAAEAKATADPYLQ
jgi:hypothetical protein